ncbi:hypothetical protein ACFOSC_11125 [Streptantibioticus rubrisoli]|uniref:Uncharacterized protein n=1 Tax=Streptantibioticus rubrisoli TaxID=1387313 RepID=A0ABT1PIS7_9ACTN|nr:hypothetical protein [Streptantibioticus rubrisoli]MCQ4045254.1 hypothetical protein [Streptantibioticus rubrisoli]
MGREPLGGFLVGRKASRIRVVIAGRRTPTERFTHDASVPGDHGAPHPIRPLARAAQRRR